MSLSRCAAAKDRQENGWKNPRAVRSCLLSFCASGYILKIACGRDFIDFEKDIDEAKKTATVAS